MTQTTPQKGMLSSLYQNAHQSQHPKSWKTILVIGTVLLWPVAWLLSPIWEAIYRPRSSELKHDTTYGWRVARWLATGTLVFGALVGLSFLTGGFFPAVLTISGLTATLTWSGAIGLATAGLLALQDIMRDGVDFYEAYARQHGYAYNHEYAKLFISFDSPSNQPDTYALQRNAKAHWRYFARWLLPSLLLTAIIVLSSGVIPAIAIGGAAGSSVFASAAASLSAAGISGVWAQLGIMAAAVFGGLSVMHMLGTLSMAISTKFDRNHDYPKTRAFFRYLAKGLHLTGFLTVIGLVFSNLAIFAAVNMGLMATPAAAAPAAGAMAAAATPVVAESSWMTILPIMAGLYTGISVALSALFGVLGVALNRKKKKTSASDQLTRLTTDEDNKQLTADPKNAVQITKDMPKKYYYSDANRSDRAYLAMILKTDGTYENASMQVKGQSKQLYIIGVTQGEKQILTYNEDKKCYMKVNNQSSFTIEKKPEDPPKEKTTKRMEMEKDTQEHTDEKDRHYYDEKQMLSLTVGKKTITVYKVVYIDKNNNWTDETIHSCNRSDKALSVYFDNGANKLYGIDGNNKHEKQSDPKTCQPENLSAVTDALRKAKAVPESSTSVHL